MKDRNEDRRGIGSVDTAMKLLDTLAFSATPMTLTQVAARTGLSNSSTHRYLVSLCRSGHIRQSFDDGRYAPGRRLVQAGFAALNHIDAVGVTIEAAEQLTARTGHTALVAIWTNEGAIIVRWRNGAKDVRTTLAEGSRLPLLDSATGRVFLSWLPDNQVLVQIPKGRKAEAAAIRKEVRAAGMAEVSGDLIPGLRAAGAPVLNHAGEAAAALTLVGRREGFTTSALTELKSLALQASERLGWNG